MADRSITYVPLEAIRPHPRNPRTHDLPALIDSITRHGFTNPLLVCERTQLLAAGHGRYDALVQMRTDGAPTPDGILVDDDGGWLVPLIRGWSSASDAALGAYVINDNELTMLGGYDDRTLAALLEDINADAPDLFDSLPFDVDDIERLTKYATDGSDLDTPPRTLDTNTDSGHADDADSDGLGTDHGMTDVPDSPKHERVTCPECGHHFRPGDKAVW